MQTFHRVLLICRVQLIMAKHSIDLVPATKKQISWSEKRHTREAAEVLFSKSLYQKQSMVSVIVWIKIHLGNITSYALFQLYTPHICVSEIVSSRDCFFQNTEYR